MPRLCPNKYLWCWIRGARHLRYVTALLAPTNPASRCFSDIVLSWPGSSLSPRRLQPCLFVSTVPDQCRNIFAKQYILAGVEDNSSNGGQIALDHGTELEKRPYLAEDDKDEDSSKDDGDIEE